MGLAEAQLNFQWKPLQNCLPWESLPLIIILEDISFMELDTWQRSKEGLPWLYVHWRFIAPKFRKCQHWPATPCCPLSLHCPLIIMLQHWYMVDVEPSGEQSVAQWGFQNLQTFTPSHRPTQATATPYGWHGPTTYRPTSSARFATFGTAPSIWSFSPPRYTILLDAGGKWATLVSFGTREFYMVVWADSGTDYTSAPTWRSWYLASAHPTHSTQVEECPETGPGTFAGSTTTSTWCWTLSPHTIQDFGNMWTGSSSYW